MKKAVFILAALVLFSTVAFASPLVSFGIWGRTVFALAESNNLDTKIYQEYAPGEAWFPAHRLEISFTSDLVEYAFKFDVRPTWIDLPNNFGTLKLIPDLLTLRIGRNTCDGFDWYRRNAHRNLDNGSAGRMQGAGIWISTAPKDTNFTAAVFYKTPSFAQGQKWLPLNVIMATEFAAMYTVPDLVKITAGSDTSGTTTSNIVRTLFLRGELIMVKGLTLWADVVFDGFEPQDVATNMDLNAMLAVSYTGITNLTLNFAGKFGMILPKAGGSSTMAWALYPGAFYKINDDVGVGIDLTASQTIKPAPAADEGIKIEVEALVKLVKFNAQISFYLMYKTVDPVTSPNMSWKVPLLIDFSLW